MRYVQRLPTGYRDIANGFKLYVGRDDNDTYILPMGMVQIDPTPAGWELIRNWPETNERDVDDGPDSLSLDQALRRP